MLPCTCAGSSIQDGEGREAERQRRRKEEGSRAVGYANSQSATRCNKRRRRPDEPHNSSILLPSPIFYRQACSLSPPCCDSVKLSASSPK